MEFVVKKKEQYNTLWVKTLSGCALRYICIVEKRSKKRLIVKKIPLEKVDSISCKKDSFLSKNLHFWSGFVGSSSSGWIRFKYAITIPSQTRKIAKASPQIVHCKDKMSYTVLTSHAGFPFAETNARTSKNQPINSLGKFLESQKEILICKPVLHFGQSKQTIQRQRNHRAQQNISPKVV